MPAPQNAACVHLDFCIAITARWRIVAVASVSIKGLPAILCSKVPCHCAFFVSCTCFPICVRADNIGYHLGSSNTREHLVEQRVAYFTEDSSSDTCPPATRNPTPSVPPSARPPSPLGIRRLCSLLPCVITYPCLLACIACTRSPVQPMSPILVGVLYVTPS